MHSLREEEEEEEAMGATYVKNFENISKILNQLQCPKNLGKYHVMCGGVQRENCTNLMLTL